MDRKQPEKQRRQQTHGHVRRQPDRNFVGEYYGQQMEPHHQGVGTNWTQPEKLEVKPEPDVLQGPVIMALRQMGGIAKPPAVIDERLPQKRPIADVTVDDDHLVIVEYVAVAEASRIDQRGYRYD